MLKVPATLLHDFFLASQLRAGRAAKPTPFDIFAENLAERGYIKCHYTTNIDCRTDNLSALFQKTLFLHGRADTLMCDFRPSHTTRVTAESFPLEITPCEWCIADALKRKEGGQRPWTIGNSRPRVLLDDEDWPDDTEIKTAFKTSLARPVNVVLIVGTTLRTPSLRKFTRLLCSAGGEPRHLGEQDADLSTTTSMGRQFPVWEDSAGQGCRRSPLRRRSAMIFGRPRRRHIPDSSPTPRKGMRRLSPRQCPETARRHHFPIRETTKDATTPGCGRITVSIPRSHASHLGMCGTEERRPGIATSITFHLGRGRGRGSSLSILGVEGDDG
jgi:NAD-dependent SIR2 family protein deacetylase